MVPVNRKEIHHSDDIKKGTSEENTFQERRSQKRIVKRSILRVNGKIAILMDLSENGMRLATLKIPSSPLIVIELRTEGQSFKLNGVIRWSSRERTFTGLKKFGVFIKDPPDQYTQYIMKLIKA